MKDKFFDNYYNNIYFWVIKKTSNKEDAKDLVQDIFCLIFTYLDKGFKVEVLDNLIWKIAYNCEK